jgi:V8-like Glu-specific endopeptidase
VAEPLISGCNDRTVPVTMRHLDSERKNQVPKKETNSANNHDFSDLPLNPHQAARLWRRDAIREFAFPQPPRSSKKLIKHKPAGETRVKMTSANLPKTLDITAAPEGARKRPRLRAGNRSVEPLFLYPPDNRYIFYDTTYPWRACGRVVTSTGHGTGTIVGPRHILTASHVVDWTENNGTIGWLRFEADYNNGDVFAPSYAVHTISYEQISSANGEYDIAEDYAVCVMDRRIGDELGWLGSKTYDDDWDGGGYWYHVGYPDDLGAGNQPVFESGFSIYNSWAPGFFENGSGLDMETFVSLTHGDSGSSIFGMWQDAPYVVGVVSAEGSLDPVATDLTVRTGNWVAGGSELPDLINQARGDYP